MRFIHKLFKNKVDDRSLNRAKELWTNIAKKDHEKVMEGICDGFDTKTFKESKQSLIFEAGIEFKESDVVLDLACGMGRICKWIAPKVKMYYGVDFIAEMIKKAKDLNKGYSNTVFITNNGTDLSAIDDNTFDTVICELAYQHMIKDTQSKITKEVYRVLKTGGKFFVQLPKVAFYKDDTYCYGDDEFGKLFNLFDHYKLLKIDNPQYIDGYYTIEATK